MFAPGVPECGTCSGNWSARRFPLLLDEELLSGGLYVAFESMGEATTSDDGVLGLWVSGSWADPSRGVFECCPTSAGRTVPKGKAQPWWPFVRDPEADIALSNSSALGTS